MRTHMLGLLCVAIALMPGTAAASNFTVTPTQVNLSSSTTSALVTLRNESKTPLRFEVTVFSWTEDERGRMTLTPSADVTFFPRLIELAGGAARNIRIGFKAGAPRDVEQSFRLFVEELPDQTAPAANAVAIRTKVGIPVFVRPAKPVRSAVIDGVSVAGGRVLTRIRNTGNLHVSVETILVTGMSAANASTFTKDGQGWYVLPGATRVFEVPLSAEECSATSTVAVEVGGHGASLKGATAVGPGSCAPAP